MGEWLIMVGCCDWLFTCAVRGQRRVRAHSWEDVAEVWEGIRGCGVWIWQAGRWAASSQAHTCCFVHKFHPQ
eukprot:scaffold196403_cov22-Tisochrysis_lutea.AAC.1